MQITGRHIGHDAPGIFFEKPPSTMRHALQMRRTFGERKIGVIDLSKLDEKELDIKLQQLESQHEQSVKD